MNPEIGGLLAQFLGGIASTHAQTTQNNLTFAQTTAQGQSGFTAALLAQQSIDLVENPSDPTELLAQLPVTAASLRGSQPPVQPAAS